MKTVRKRFVFAILASALLVSFFAFSLNSATSAQTSSSLTIANSGSVVASTSSAALKFSTDFENAVVSGGTSVSGIGISSGIGTEGSGGAGVWIEGVNRQTSGVKPQAEAVVSAWKSRTSQNLVDLNLY